MWDSLWRLTALSSVSISVAAWESPHTHYALTSPWGKGCSCQFHSGREPLAPKNDELLCSPWKPFLEGCRFLSSAGRGRTHSENLTHMAEFQECIFFSTTSLERKPQCFKIYLILVLNSCNKEIRKLKVAPTIGHSQQGLWPHWCGTGGFQSLTFPQSDFTWALTFPQSDFTWAWPNFFESPWA